MRIPSLDDFRQAPGPVLLSPWYADYKDADFTLMLPDGGDAEEDGEWLPHRPSYQMAQDVLPDLDWLGERARSFLAGILDLERLELEGEPFVICLVCDARAQRVTVELEWTRELYLRFGVTFACRMEHPQQSDRYTPLEMSMTGR
jgi:hypothetical protein